MIAEAEKLRFLIGFFDEDGLSLCGGIVLELFTVFFSGSIAAVLFFAAASHTSLRECVCRLGNRSDQSDLARKFSLRPPGNQVVSIRGTQG
jgi:hypothetical protein